jgi:hypothetical protein
VVVKRDHDRHRITRDGAHAPQKLGFGVVEARRGHGAVQLQVDGIEPIEGPQRREQGLAHVFEGLVAHQATGTAGSPGQGVQPGVVANGAQKAGRGEAALCQALVQGLSLQQGRSVALGQKVREPHVLRRSEGIGLV